MPEKIVWTVNDTNVLISSLIQLKACKLLEEKKMRSSEIFDNVTQKMMQYGVDDKTSKQVALKFRKLKTKYRDSKHDKTGFLRSKFHFYDKMKNLLENPRKARTIRVRTIPLKKSRVEKGDFVERGRFIPTINVRQLQEREGPAFTKTTAETTTKLTHSKNKKANKRVMTSLEQIGHQEVVNRNFLNELDDFNVLMCPPIIKEEVDPGLEPIVEPSTQWQFPSLHEDDALNVEQQGMVVNEEIDFQTEMLQSIRNIESNTRQQGSDLKKHEEKMYELELQKNKLLEKFVNVASELKTAIIQFLSK